MKPGDTQPSNTDAGAIAASQGAADKPRGPRPYEIAPKPSLAPQTSIDAAASLAVGGTSGGGRRSYEILPDAASVKATSTTQRIPDGRAKRPHEILPGATSTLRPEAPNAPLGFATKRPYEILPGPSTTPSRRDDGSRHNALKAYEIAAAPKAPAALSPVVTLANPVSSLRNSNVVQANDPNKFYSRVSTTTFGPRTSEGALPARTICPLLPPSSSFRAPDRSGNPYERYLMQEVSLCYLSAPPGAGTGTILVGCNYLGGLTDPPGSFEGYGSNEVFLAWLTSRPTLDAGIRWDIRAGTDGGEARFGESFLASRQRRWWGDPTMRSFGTQALYVQMGQSNQSSLADMVVLMAMSSDGPRRATEVTTPDSRSFIDIPDATFAPDGSVWVVWHSSLDGITVRGGRIRPSAASSDPTIVDWFGDPIVFRGLDPSANYPRIQVTLRGGEYIVMVVHTVLNPSSPNTLSFWAVVAQYGPERLVVHMPVRIKADVPYQIRVGPVGRPGSSPALLSRNSRRASFVFDSNNQQLVVVIPSASVGGNYSLQGSGIEVHRSAVIDDMMMIHFSGVPEFVPERSAGTWQYFPELAYEAVSGAVGLAWYEAQFRVAAVGGEDTVAVYSTGTTGRTVGAWSRAVRLSDYFVPRGIARYRGADAPIVDHNAMTDDFRPLGDYLGIAAVPSGPPFGQVDRASFLVAWTAQAGSHTNYIGLGGFSVSDLLLCST